MIKILISEKILFFFCGFYESMSILPLNSVYYSTETLSMTISIKTYVFTLKDFSCFALYDFSQLLLSFSANIFTLSPLECYIFHKYKYSHWSTLSLYEAWKNLATFWFSCTEAALVLTSIVSLLPCTSSFLHQSFGLDSVSRMDSD